MAIGAVSFVDPFRQIMAFNDVQQAPESCAIERLRLSPSIGLKITPVTVLMLETSDVKGASQIRWAPDHAGPASSYAAQAQVADQFGPIIGIKIW